MQVRHLNFILALNVCQVLDLCSHGCKLWWNRRHSKEAANHCQKTGGLSTWRQPVENVLHGGVWSKVSTNDPSQGLISTSIAAHPRKIQCTSGFSVMNSQSPNPNVLVGAMVGGPDEHDRFPDERSDYEQSEQLLTLTHPW
ncbi:hypothetical protein NC653_007715 [Populus alba x Populus x berolinensis]|uniref:cellulase n=1 Tax=Populus alba x Populus x berolinensis TaxID=444605 RepID=A0AAD6RI13_9ROSI|nr:hypothetical protein NC653_007715 [Populus alba x Populus x berolinensis]